MRILKNKYLADKAQFGLALDLDVANRLDAEKRKKRTSRAKIITDALNMYFDTLDANLDIAS